MEWFVYAIIATIIIAAMYLLIKKGHLIGGNEIILLFYTFIFAAIFLFVYILANKIPLSVSNPVLIIIILLGIGSFIANVLVFKSVVLAPNPGYTGVITGTSALIVIFASFIHKNHNANNKKYYDDEYSK